MNIILARKTIFSAMSDIICKAFRNTINLFNFFVERDIAINEVLFYGKEERAAAKQTEVDNMFCIKFVMIHASSTLDVCVPSLVSDTITKCLIYCAQKQIKVRVAIHRCEDVSGLEELVQKGIEVKLINCIILEHEFMLVDAGSEFEAVAVTGALDCDVFRGNCNDNTMMTSEGTLVRALKWEFERVWGSAPLYVNNIVKI